MLESPIELVAIVMIAAVGVLCLPWRAMAVRESWGVVSTAPEWIARGAERALAPTAAKKEGPTPRPLPFAGRALVAPRPTIHPAFRTYSTFTTQVDKTA